MYGHASLDALGADRERVDQSPQDRRRNDGLEAIKDDLLDADEQTKAGVLLLGVLGAGSAAGFASAWSAPDATLEVALVLWSGYLVALCGLLVVKCLWAPGIPQATREALSVLRNVALDYGRRKCDLDDFKHYLKVVEIHTASRSTWLNIIRLLAVAVPLLAALGVFFGAIFHAF